ncbi:MAG: PQQ-binding-like beta-propeller repeat protein [Terriglobia bacterium]
MRLSKRKARRKKRGRTNAIQKALILGIYFLGMGFTTLKANAQDWPQFLGPSRNGVYSGAPLGEAWPATGPPLVWKIPAGQGFSSPVVSNHKVILFHREENQERIDCLDSKSGKLIWSFSYPTRYRDDFGFDEGPRGTPAIVAGFVYTFGAEGMLHCLNFENGQRVWSVDTREKFRFQKGFFGAACSPLVEGGNVVVNIGGSEGSGIVAFNAKDGTVAWKATNDEAGYSSPVAATMNGIRYLLCLTRAGLTVLEPVNGKIISQVPFRSKMNASVNAAVPLEENNQVFLSASYQTGAVLLQWLGQGFKTIWASDDVLSNHYANSVFDSGVLFGFHGRQEYGPSLRSVDWQTGKVNWSIDDFNAGTVLLAGNLLLVLRENGELLLAPASPREFRVLARWKILSPTVRAYPAIADGFLFARNEKQMVCVDLRKKK